MQEIEPTALTVTQVTRQIKSAIEEQPELRHVWVRGEISNFTRHSSGHWYFNIKDANSQIRAVMFRRNVQTVRDNIQEGQEVLALGSITVYEKRGEYQLYVTAMRAAGLGALFQEFEKLKKKLEAEGLFDEERKRPIPTLPAKLAVVTSPTGAAVRDVVNIITRRFPALELTVVPALVQGEGAPESIRAALKRAAALPGVDTILLVRGGGSIEDLWGFNDEALARDIAACPVPVISGVGHETDFTISDFVSDLRAPTPSAAAERAVPELAALRDQAKYVSGRLARAVSGRVQYENQRLRTFSTVLSIRQLRDMVRQKKQTLDDLESSAVVHLRHRLESMRMSVSGIGDRLEALNPMAVLGRGYAVLRNAGTGKLVASIQDVSEGNEITATIKDGSLRAVVVQKSGSIDHGAKKRKGELPF